MSQRYFIELAYNGSGFNGWQRQLNASSVQQTIEDAMSLLLKEPVAIVGAGRTDTGVHAKYYVAHFDLVTKIENIDVFVQKLNRFLRQNIAIYSVFEVPDTAHARFDAFSRSYEYHLLTNKDPFLELLAYRSTVNLDFDAMNSAAKKLFLFDDFTSFAKLHSDTKNNICKITRAEWVQQSQFHWVFYISANRFLRNMVRAITGTLIDVGRGAIDVDGFVDIIEKKDRCKAGTSVPPNALFLTDIRYPDQIMSFHPLARK